MKFILQLVVLWGFGFTTLTQAAEEYPKALTAESARQYFAQNPKIKMRKPGYGFTFTIKGRDIERDCADCHNVFSYGSVSYNAEKVCFDWDVGFPPSGCFHFVQVSSGGFELQNDHGEMVYAWGSKNEKVVIKAGPGYKKVYERAILIEIEENKYPENKIHDALIQAMKNKGWRIEKDEKGIILAALDRSDRVYRVMGKIRGNWIAVGFVQGYANNSDSWLNNIKLQFLAQLGP